MNRLALTLDIDWAPDWMIDDVAAQLVERKVKATWFATHPSDAVNRLRACPGLFEIGLHPNFLPGSSHGDAPEVVMRTLTTWFPEARAARAHCLYQSERHLQLMCERFGILVDCSIFLKDAEAIVPHRIRYSPKGPPLLRIPHSFQDNMHINEPMTWSLEAPVFAGLGLKVLNFHPVHLALNSGTPAAYQRLKKKTGIPNATREDVARLRNVGAGAETLFVAVVERLERAGSQTISEIARAYL